MIQVAPILCIIFSFILETIYAVSKTPHNYTNTPYQYILYYHKYYEYMKIRLFVLLTLLMVFTSYTLINIITLCFLVVHTFDMMTRSNHQVRIGLFHHLAYALCVCLFATNISEPVLETIIYQYGSVLLLLIN